MIEEEEDAPRYATAIAEVEPPLISAAIQAAL